MIRFLEWIPRVTPWRHARIEELLAWLDGELRAAEAKRIASHVVACRSCCTEAARLYGARRPAASSASREDHEARALDETFRGLQANIHSWRSLQGAQSERGYDSSPPRETLEGDAGPLSPARLTRDQRATSALELYFGTRAATRIARSRGLAREDEAHLLPASQALFSVFLGRRASEALARQIAGTSG
ncbi:MAG: hypothetical protein ACRD2X_10895 [Vicinamibacteraceae bacterium]